MRALSEAARAGRDKARKAPGEDTVPAIWRGTVTEITDEGAWLAIPRLTDSLRHGPAENVSGSSLSVDDRVLVSMVEGRKESPVIVGKFMGEEGDNRVYAERLTRDLTVLIPRDYPTLQDAVDSLASVQVDQGVRIFLRIQGGHELSRGLSVIGGDHSKFWIESEDGSVPVAEDFTPVDSSSVSESNTAVFYFENCRAPVLACLIEGGGARTFDGLIAHRGTHVDVQEGAGVQGTRMNLEVRDGTISAKSTKWSHASRGCIRLTDNTRFSISGSECHDSWRNPPAGHSPISAALHISRASMGQAQTMRIDRSGFRAISVRRSMVHLDGTTINGTGLSGGSTQGAINLMAGASVVLGTVTFNGNPITPAQCGMAAFNLPTFHGTVYGTGPDLVNVRDTQSVTATNIANRLTIQQRLFPGFSLNNPDTTLALGEEMRISGAFLSVAQGTAWMAGSGFNARLRAFNTLVVGVGATGNGVRIRMADQSLAVNDTIDLVVTIIGAPAV